MVHQLLDESTSTGQRIREKAAPSIESFEIIQGRESLAFSLKCGGIRHVKRALLTRLPQRYYMFGIPLLCH